MILIHSFDLRRAELYLRKALYIIELKEKSVLSNQKIGKKRKPLLNEENNKADILFNLGYLLSTFDSLIIKKEAFNFLRRSLDIKLLNNDELHPECQKIKSVLYKIAVETAHQYSQNENIDSSIKNESQNIFNKRFCSLNTIKREKRSLNNYSEMNRRVNQRNELNQWIMKNSLIEKNRKQMDNQSVSFLSF